MVVDYVKVTPLHEAGDEHVPESYPDFGWGSLEDTNTLPCNTNTNTNTNAPTPAPTPAPTTAGPNNIDCVDCAPTTRGRRQTNV